ncbi:probable strigolactone esterase DAD2 [Hibiscus syriacus]|uniref:probable strigolactone esterase DAD2 n=1 Tax=Hibiscus syriacus TaxID=106335 RepID=UPI001922D438|nr:probable strigolactone esterase DAD2 [Hibiscus syriacus]
MALFEEERSTEKPSSSSPSSLSPTASSQSVNYLAKSVPRGSVIVQQGNSCKEWLEWVASRLDLDGLSRLIVLLWNVWNRRNKWVHDEEIQEDRDVMTITLGLCAKFSGANQADCFTRPQQRSFKCHKWSCPDPSYVKINVDGAYKPSENTTVISVVGRDHNAMVLEGRKLSGFVGLRGGLFAASHELPSEAKEASIELVVIGEDGDLLSICNGKLCANGGIADALNAKIYGNDTQTVVLAHGFGETQGAWHFLLPMLALYFKVVVFDMVFSPNVDPLLYDPQRYHSDFKAYADDLVCLADRLQLNHTVYVGHSMAAMVGCLAAINRPHLFNHLVLLSGSPRYINEEGYEGGFTKSEIKAVYRNISENFRGWVQNFAPTAVGVNNTAAIAEFNKSLGRMKPDIALSAAKAVFSSDLRHKLPRVKVPCTIIQSKNDYIVPRAVAFYMKSKVGGNAKVKMLNTEGHFPHLTAYNLLFRVLKQVLIKK